MLLTKVSLVIATSLLLVNTSGATSCANKGAKPEPEPANRAGSVSMPNAESSRDPRNDKEATQREIKVLAEGAHSEVTNAFLVVARDAQVYANLRTLVAGLPDLKDEFFKSRAVVAAFMGERNTGGYSVEITRAPNGAIRVAAGSPPKDAMVTQVITAPFRVVSVPSSPALALEAEGGWQQAMRSYRITSGEFTMSGGFAGRMERFALEGEIRVMREGKLVTLLFDVKSSGAQKQRSLKEAATGSVENGTVYVSRLGAGSLIELPHSDLSANGRFAYKNSELALDFKSLPTMIADGFAGQGNIQAEAPAPIPPGKPVVNNKPM